MAPLLLVVQHPKEHDQDPKVIIDAAFHPEIIDSIFEQAPLGSLLAFRRVNKAWKRRATRQIAFHLIVEEGDEVCIRSGLSTGGALVTPASDFTERRWRSWRFNANTRVCDFSTPIFPKIQHILGVFHFASVLRNVNTIRFLPSCHVNPVRHHLLRPKRVVYFDYNRNLEKLNELNIPAAKKVVIHLTQPSKPSRSRVGFLDPFIVLCNVVVIVHPWEAPLIMRDVTDATLEDAFNDATLEEAVEGTLGGLLRLVYACKEDNFSISVVGLERLTPAALGFRSDHDLFGATVEDIVTTYLTLGHPPHQPVPGLGRNYSLTFQRLEDYRASIGERDFQIETQERLTLWPRTLK